MIDGLTLDGVLMIFQGKDNLGGILEVLNRGVSWEDLVPDKEKELQEGDGTGLSYGGTCTGCTHMT